MYLRSPSKFQEKEILMVSKLLEMSFSVPEMFLSLSKEESPSQENPIALVC